MANYINREKAIAEIYKGDLLVGDNAKWAKEILYRTPAEDVVPVVRCKDCTEWDKDECECSHWYGFKENDYCSYGERKEE